MNGILRIVLYHVDSGEYFASFKESNLHVVGYSTPINLFIDLEDLDEHLFVLDDQPDVIPYITSYYKETWGFCISKNLKDKLPSGLYHAVISSELSKGSLDLSHALLQGNALSEIFFSSYVCHPSLANNELSGPVVLNALLDYIKISYPEPRFSYRFALVPETIGAIAYLSKFLSDMQKYMVCGFNLSCVGDNRSFSYVETPYADTLADKAISAALIGKNNVKVFSF